MALNLEDEIASNYFVYNNCQSPNEPEFNRCFKGGITRPNGVCHNPQSTIPSTTIVISTKTRGDYV